MRKQYKSQGGVIVCGACAVPADPHCIEPTSIDKLCDGLKSIAEKLFHRA